jgi:hypothetical protein
MPMRPTRRGQTAPARRAGGKLAWAPLIAAALVAQFAAGAQASSATLQPESGLASVACTSSSACLAVGARQGHNLQDRIIALAWNGTAWSLQTALNPKTNRPDDLNGIACVSPSECFGAGSIGSFNNASHKALIERWNGTAWSLQVLGSPTGTLNTFFNGVSCGGPFACFAVGDENDNTSLMPNALVERWNGSAWSVQAVPDPANSTAVSLESVSCASPSDCTAVGVYGLPGGIQQTLAEHFNGHTWSIEPMPTFGSSIHPVLFGVSCSGADCVAVGEEFSPQGVTALAEQFNGTKWSVTRLAKPAGASSFGLSGLDCTSPSACYAVGGSSNPGTSATLIEQWNGSSWTVVPSPNAAGVNSLAAVSCASAQSCMAVGRHRQGTSVSTLAVRLSAGVWAITPTPSPG